MKVEDRLTGLQSWLFGLRRSDTDRARLREVIQSWAVLKYEGQWRHNKCSNNSAEKRFDITLKPAASCPGSPQGCWSDKAMAWTPRHFSQSDETFDAWL